MAYRPMKYQYETSPRKLKPEYEPIKNDDVKKKSSTLKQKNKKQTNQIIPKTKWLQLHKTELKKLKKMVSP